MGIMYSMMPTSSDRYLAGQKLNYMYVRDNRCFSLPLSLSLSLAGCLKSISLYGFKFSYNYIMLFEIQNKVPVLIYLPLSTELFHKDFFSLILTSHTERAKHSFLLRLILLSCLVMNKICLNKVVITHLKCLYLFVALICHLWNTPLHTPQLIR